MEKIRNPATGRWVKEDGPTGRKVQQDIRDGILVPTRRYIEGEVEMVYADSNTGRVALYHQEKMAAAAAKEVVDRAAAMAMRDTAPTGTWAVLSADLSIYERTANVIRIMHNLVDALLEGLQNESFGDIPRIVEEYDGTVIITGGQDVSYRDRVVVYPLVAGVDVDLWKVLFYGDSGTHHT